MPEPAAAAPAGPALLRGATVIDGTGAPARPGTDILLHGDRIAAVGSAAAAAAAAHGGHRVIDVRGKYVIPGLWDMHTHAAAGEPDVYPLLYLANGVTGIREMWGDPATYALRDRIARGEAQGPRMVVASPVIDGPDSAWEATVRAGGEDAARAAVRDAAVGGADFIKVYSYLERHALKAVLDEAGRHGLAVVGHLPWRVPAAEASDLGMAGFEHLYGLPIAVSARGGETMRTLAEAPVDPDRAKAFFAQAARLDREASLHYDPRLAEALFARLAGNGTRQTPTLTVLATTCVAPEERAGDPRLDYIPAWVRAMWASSAAKSAPKTAEELQRRRAFLEFRYRLVAGMHRAGVPLLGGTDAMFGYVFPGFSAHEELARLVAAGVPPLSAVASMTGDAARFLGLDADAGTIAAGRSADLLILDADPLADIGNTARIDTVVVRGGFLGRSERERLLDSARSAAARRDGRPAAP